MRFFRQNRFPVFQQGCRRCRKLPAHCVAMVPPLVPSTFGLRRPGECASFLPMTSALFSPLCPPSPGSKKGEIIYQEGDPADAVCNLNSGVVTAYRKAPDGSEHVVAFLLADDLFSLSAEGLYTNSMRALTAVTAYRLPVSALRSRPCRGSTQLSNCQAAKPLNVAVDGFLLTSLPETRLAQVCGRGMMHQMLTKLRLGHRSYDLGRIEWTPLGASGSVQKHWKAH